MPDRVVGYRPDKPGPSPELGQPDRRVRHRSPRDEAGVRHDALDGSGLVQVDQGHGSLDQAHLCQYLVACRLEDVQQWRSDRHQVQLRPAGVVDSPGFRSIRSHPRSENLLGARRVAFPTMSSSPLTPTTTHQDAFRLPRTVEPHVYRLEIEPDIGSATFSGTVAIDVTVHESVDRIVLNAAELAISDVEVRTATGDVIGCTVSFEDELEQVDLPPPGPPRARGLHGDVPVHGHPQ